MNTKPMYMGEQESLEEHYRFIEGNVDSNAPNSPKPDLNKSNLGYSDLVSIVYSIIELEGKTKLHFNTFEAASKRDEGAKAGAILVTIPMSERGLKDQWIPKSLCANLDLEACTVYVYTKFYDEKIKGYIYNG